MWREGGSHIASGRPGTALNETRQFQVCQPRRRRARMVPRPGVSRDLGVVDMRGITRGTRSRILMGNLAYAAGGRVTNIAGREQTRRRSSSS